MEQLSLELEKQQFAYYSNIPPVFSIKDGESLRIRTMDAFCDTATPSTTHLSKLAKPGDNPCVGPIYVSEAEPGDTLKIEILNIAPARDYAISGILPSFGGLTANAMSPVLNEPLKEKCYCYRMNSEQRFVYNDHLSFPFKPFIGSIATAPNIGAPKTVDLFSGGGNMDVPEVCPGNTLYLPVAVTGAYLYLGDVHACQGQSELCGSALEISAFVTIRVSVCKNKTIRYPRIENQESLMCVGIAKPMEDAARIAEYELLHWLVEEYDWDRFEAYQLLTQCGKLHVGSMVNSSHSMVASIDKTVVLNR